MTITTVNTTTCSYTREVETARMLSLREAGYSNAEIAKKVGVVPLTVRRRIGVQNPIMTRENRVIAQKRRAQRNRDRERIANHIKMARYEEAAKRVRELNAQIQVLEKEVEKQKGIMESLSSVPNATSSKAVTYIQ